MDKQFSLKGRKVLIIGGGVSGNGAYEAVRALGGESVIYKDSDGGLIPDAGFDLIVISPSIAKEHIIYKFAREKKIPLIGEIELGYKIFGGEIAAVTGTNGKTTTTALIGQMLKNDNKSVSVCGNIGVSFSKCAALEKADYAALEVSSFQLESIQDFKPKIACVLNLTPDHLDRHKNMEEYIRSKLNIASNQDESDYLILSQDDIPLISLENFHPAAQVLYTSVRGKVKGAYLMGGKIFFFDEYICDRDQIRLMGTHNVSNALAAICACKLLGVSNKAIIETLSTFDSPAHRIKNVGTYLGKTFYNDSKGTNIAATLKAVQTLSSDTCLILGGSDKGYEFDELFVNLPPTVKHVYVIGETADKIIAAAYRNRFYEIEKKNTLEETVFDSVMLSVDSVLLSPACASFDMFFNYADRGERFVKAVRELVK